VGEFVDENRHLSVSASGVEFSICGSLKRRNNFLFGRVARHLERK
jgi:hypothetical protein